MSIQEMDPLNQSDALVGQCARKVDLCALITTQGRPVAVAYPYTMSIV